MGSWHWTKIPVTPSKCGANLVQVQILISHAHGKKHAPKIRLTGSPWDVGIGLLLKQNPLFIMLRGVSKLLIVLNKSGTNSMSPVWNFSKPHCDGSLDIGIHRSGLFQPCLESMFVRRYVASLRCFPKLSSGPDGDFDTRNLNY